MPGPENVREHPVAERKPEDPSYKHSQPVLENILENFPGIVFWKDRYSVYLGCNKNFAVVTGFNDPAELQGKTDYDIPGVRDHAEKYRADDRQVMASGKPKLNIVERIHSADGTARLYSTNKVPLSDADGRIIGVLGAGNDITERKQADERLELANAILKTQQETALEGILIVDEQRQIISYNRRFVDMWGIPENVVVSHSDELAIKVITDRLADPRKFAEKVAYLYDHPYERSFDEIELKGNITFERYSAPMSGPEGRYYGRVWYFKDITERKRAEEALKFASTYNRRLIEASLDPLVTIAPDGRITDVNTATEAVTGYPREKLIGTDFTEYFTDPAKAREGYRKVFEKGSVIDYPLEIKSREGHITPVLYNATVYRDETGKITGVFAAARDITERKQAEEALRLEHDQLLSIFESIDELIYVSDPYTYEVLFANKWTQKRFDRKVIGGKCYREFQDRASPCDFCTNDIILKDKGKPYYWEYHNPVIDRDYWIVDRIIRWPDGRDVRFEMAMDITEHKQALSDAKDARARAELYLDLMSHDITNMNQAIMGHLELLEALQERGSSEKELTDVSVEIIKRSARMINNVKKLTEIEAGKVPLREVNLCAILSQVISEHTGVEGGNVRINAGICDKCEVLAGDMLKEVFENLVDNAIRHSGGQVIVDITIDRIVQDGQGYYRISVADNGPGIPDELKKRLFPQAQELDKKSERRGFGIYVVRALIKHYQGMVWVEDRVPGDYTRGSKFIVLLPVGQPATAANRS